MAFENVERKWSLSDVRDNERWQENEGWLNVFGIDANLHVGHIMVFGDGGNEHKSDARLVANAPKLLDFAKEMVRRYPNSPHIVEQAQGIINDIENK